NRPRDYRSDPKRDQRRPSLRHHLAPPTQWNRPTPIARLGPSPSCLPGVTALHRKETGRQKQSRLVFSLLPSNCFRLLPAVAVEEVHNHAVQKAHPQVPGCLPVAPLASRVVQRPLSAVSIL